MGKRSLRGVLELTWMGKDQALIPTADNTYDYTWVDKNDPRACQTHYLNITEHVGDESDGGIHDNLLVTGDSGDVLEALTRVPELAEKYVGKVKCIYIDPPFNTGGAFTNYEDNLEHSIWLTMMRDRLVLMKRLLSEDGSIWVHLDDSENHRMRMLMDEVFGPENFVTEVTWEKTYSPRNDAKGVSSRTDTILVYRASDRWVPNRLSRTAEMDARYTNPDNDPSGPWKSADPSASGAKTHQGMVYAIEQPTTGELVYPSPGRHWNNGQEDMLTLLRGWSDQYELVDLHDEEERARRCGIPVGEVRPGVKGIVIGGDKSVARAEAQHVYERGQWPIYWLTRGGKGGFGRKSYLEEVAGRTPENLWLHGEVGHTDGAKKEIQALFPDVPPFATPKPELLLERIIHIATNPGDLVMDVFAGSGTTAAVAHKMGRKWITVELLDDTVDKYTRPRLEKVVAGEDPGGITTTTVWEAEEELPGNTSVKEARTFNTVLGRALKTLSASEIGLNEKQLIDLKSAIKLLRQTTKTKKKVVTNWEGGGGFDVARLSPQWVGVEEGSTPDTDIMFILPDASGEVLGRSLAGHLGFHYLADDLRFTGVKGRQYLAVVEGIASSDKIQELLGALPQESSITLVCDGADEDASQLLYERSRGSRIILMPYDLFSYNAWEVE